MRIDDLNRPIAGLKFEGLRGGAHCRQRPPRHIRLENLHRPPRVRDSPRRHHHLPDRTLVASIAAASAPTADRDEAWRAAWIDRFGVGPQATRRDRRLARYIVRQQWRADRAAALRGDLMIVSGVILPARLSELRSIPDSRPEPTSTPNETPKLSARAAATLERARTEIAAGTLSETPSAKAIQRQFRVGMETAIAVRNALRTRRSADREEVA